MVIAKVIYINIFQVKLQVPNIPNDASAGNHEIPFSNIIYIDREDFKEVTHTRNTSIVFANMNVFKHFRKLVQVNL